MIVYVQSRNGATLVRAVSVEDGMRWARAEWGHDAEPYRARRAAPDDVAWVQSMGGATHETNAACRRLRAAPAEAGEER